MKAYTILGYAADAALYCPDCAERLYPELETDTEGNDITPVFACHEHPDGQPYCDGCGETLHS
jgi:hypothetical protein